VPEIEAVEATKQPATPPIAHGPAGLTAFRALRHRNFRLFFGGQLVSLIAPDAVRRASLARLKLTNRR